MNEFWRDARDGGYFSYKMATKGLKNLSLLVRYWGNDGGNRTFDIYIDGSKLVTENIAGKWNVNEFRNVEYLIPDTMVVGKTFVRVKFQSKTGNVAGGAFFIRMLKNEISSIISTNKMSSAVQIVGQKGSIDFYNIQENSNIRIFDLSGRMLHSVNTNKQNLNIDIHSGMYIITFLNAIHKVCVCKLVRVS
jgi:hypothetical protein